MTLHTLDHVCFLLIAVLLPIVDFHSLRGYASSIAAGHSGQRMSLYRSIIGQSWAITILLLTLWFLLGRDAAGLGLVPGGGGWAWLGYALAALLCLLTLAQARAIIAHPERQAAVRERIGEASFLTPRSPEERRAFSLVSVTAGVCEEVIYRGFVIAYLMAALDIPFWAAALLSSLVFGLDHLYQGPRGAIRAAATGLALAALYGVTGSLWAPVVTHTVIDLTAGHIAAVLASDPDAAPREDAA